MLNNERIIVGTIKTKDCTATYKDDDATKQAVFDRVLEYFKKHEAFWGESIHQRDDPIMDAPSVMSDIADDILQFQVADDD